LVNGALQESLVEKRHALRIRRLNSVHAYAGSPVQARAFFFAGQTMEVKAHVAGIGSVQFIVSTAVIGIGIRTLGAPGAAAIILGLALAMSSTAVMMQLLEEQGRSATP
jgi:Kef-type K+ transport system membrane component KefB